VASKNTHFAAKKPLETRKVAYRSSLVLIGFTLGYAAAFTLMLLYLYLATGNVIILLVGGVLAASLPFAYGYYVSRAKRRN